MEIVGDCMINKVLHYVEEHHMLTKKDKVVLGVSGGADSICLFFVMLTLREIYDLELYVVHINHGIRGKEADEDEEFVRSLCMTKKVPFHAVHANVKERAKAEGLSEEEAGRNVRYQAFYEECEKYQCRKIAIAHNMNDSAETILFNLFRGSGIKGLVGISTVRDKIIRPLLCVSREEIEDYLKEIKMDYRTDQTNLLEDYSRNKIRLRVLPYVTKEINDQAVRHIVNTGSLLNETLSYVEKNAREAYERLVSFEKNKRKYSFLVDNIRKEDVVIQKIILRMILGNVVGDLKDLTGKHVDMILELFDKGVGKKIDLPYGAQAIRGYDSIEIHKKDSKQINKSDSNLIKIGNNDNNHDESSKDKEEILSIPIQVSGEYFEPFFQWNITFTLINYKKNLIIPRNGCTKWFDYDRIKNTVFLRNRNEGDYIQIDDKGSRKKIKSLFIDNKVPREIRDKVPLLADGSHIMWVLGGRMSEAYKVNENTKRILIVKLDGGNNNGRQD